MLTYCILQILVSWNHCVKSVRSRSFSGLNFPAFGLNTEISSVNLCIQCECGEIRTRKTPNKGNFYAVRVRLMGRGEKHDKKMESNPELLFLKKQLFKAHVLECCFLLISVFSESRCIFLEFSSRFLQKSRYLRRKFFMILFWSISMEKLYFSIFNKKL